MEDKIIIEGRQRCTINGVVDVISFDLNEIILETKAGLLSIKGKDLHVQGLNVEQGEVKLFGTIDGLQYSDTVNAKKETGSVLAKWFR